MIESHPLDIPEFLRRDINETRRPVSASTIKMPTNDPKRPANWHMLTKAEQNGTADPATIELRAQMERSKKEKQAERFAELKARNAGKPRLPRAPKPPKANDFAAKPGKTPAAKREAKGLPPIRKPARAGRTPKAGKTERYGVATEGDVIAFSFDATSSQNARVVLKALRKAGKTPKVKITSLRRIRPEDKGVGGKPIPHIGSH